MLKRLLLGLLFRFRNFMLADLMATVRALHEDQIRHITVLNHEQNQLIQALHDNLYKHGQLIYEEQLKPAGGPRGQQGFEDLASTMEAALLTIALHTGETRQDQKSH